MRLEYEYLQYISHGYKAIRNFLVKGYLYSQKHQPILLNPVYALILTYYHNMIVNTITLYPLNFILSTITLTYSFIESSVSVFHLAIKPTE